MNDLCGQFGYLNTNCQEDNSSVHDTNTLQNLITLMQKNQSNMNDFCGQLGYVNTNGQEGSKSLHHLKAICFNCDWHCKITTSMGARGLVWIDFEV
ncbi:hypothetical protein P8452_28164 [Trifolium repens]|nr:hypothetical protein P8452_28164 [Trifolium repens]